MLYLRRRAINHKGNEMTQAEFLQGQVAWAEKVLNAPNVQYQNGRMSHECANEVMEKAQDELIDHARYSVGPNGMQFSHYE